MPGVERLSIDLVVEAVGEAVALGIPAVALFPATDAEAQDAPSARRRSIRRISSAGRCGR